MLYAVFFARRRQELVDFREKINWIPFYEKVLFLQKIGNLESQKQFAFYSDFLGNFLMFIPFALALQWFSAKKYSSRTLIYSVFLCSLSIETIQYILNIGVADIDDVVLNTIGGIAGILVFNFLNLKFITT